MRRFLGLRAVLALALGLSLGGLTPPVLAQAPQSTAPAPAGHASQTPKYGGVLNVMQREDLPQGLAIHETSTIAVVWPASPCFYSFGRMQDVWLDR